MSQQDQLLQIRKNIFLGAYAAGIGHVASSLSLVEILYALYFKGGLKHDPKAPEWEERDRLVLSKGHGSLALYAVMSAVGYFSEKELLKFGSVQSSLGGEPVKQITPGVEASTGSLGHGLSMGVGMALAFKRDDRKNRCYVILGDGECQEGSVWEAVMLAPRFQLNNLTVIIDDNGIQKQDRVQNIVGINNLGACFKAFGWNVQEADGHCVEELAGCIDICKNNPGPSVILAHTIKGRGLSFMENKPEWHYRMPGKRDLKTAMKELGITEEELALCKERL